MDRDFHPRFSLRYYNGDTVVDVPLARPTGEVYELEDEIAMMVAAVRDGGRVAATCHDGKWSVSLCLAAQESIQTESVVSVPLFLG